MQLIPVYLGGTYSPDGTGLAMYDRAWPYRQRQSADGTQVNADTITGEAGNDTVNAGYGQ